MSRTVIEELPASPQLDFVFGRFDLSDKWAVPYFSTTMSLRQAAESLKLVNELPGASDLAWKLDDLYQRDIDWGRVQSQIVPYLASSEQPQFFNALTIAFLPFRDGEVRNSFEGGGWQAPGLQDVGFKKDFTVGPVSLGYFEPWKLPSEKGARTGHIKWNPTQVFGVAIDGQHRLAAIKIAARKPRPELEQTRVPVIILIPDERVGFRSPKNTRLVELMRSLFIDLNKHAKSVSRPRQILLDDRDPHSLCVRALVGGQIERGKAELEGSVPVVPLSLVDWHSEQAKFDDGPYLTTILGLDWIIEKALGTKPIKDYADYPAVNKQLRALSGTLGLNLSGVESPTFQRFSKNLKQAVEPFSYTGSWNHDNPPEGELGAIVANFRKIWARPLVRILTQLAPYAQLIDLRDEVDTLNPEFVNWHYLSRRQNQGQPAIDELRGFEAELKNRKSNRITEAELTERLRRVEELKGESLAFKVVFQRALVWAFLDFVRIDADELPAIDEDPSEEQEEEFEEATPTDFTSNVAARAKKCDERAKQFVDALNQVIEAAPQVLEVRGQFGEDEKYIWHGSLFDVAANAVDFTVAASDRARDLIFFAAALVMCSSSEEAGLGKDFDELWEAIEGGELGLHRRILDKVQRKAASEKGFGGRIVQAKGAFDEGEAADEVKERLQWLWEVLAPRPKKAAKKKARKR
jgi:DGQHR domain-containing protein